MRRRTRLTKPGHKTRWNLSHGTVIDGPPGFGTALSNTAPKKKAIGIRMQIPHWLSSIGTALLLKPKSKATHFSLLIMAIGMDRSNKNRHYATKIGRVSIGSEP